MVHIVYSIRFKNGVSILAEVSFLFQLDLRGECHFL